MANVRNTARAIHVGHFLNLNRPKTMLYKKVRAHEL